jgi:ankyrin repeat protein
MRTVPLKDSKIESNPRLEPICNLLKEGKYKEVADLFGHKVTQPPTTRATNYWFPFAQTFLKENPQAPARNFSTKEVGQIATWLSENKADFAKIFLMTPLGTILAKATFIECQSPIFAALESHPKFFEIIESYDFPPEQLGNLLIQFIKEGKKEKANELLGCYSGSTYRQKDGYYLFDHTAFNDRCDGNPTRCYESQTGNRPLHLACMEEKRDDTLIRALLKRGAFLTDRNKARETPLSLLSKKGTNLDEFFSTHIGVISEEHFCKLILALSLGDEFGTAKALIQRADALPISLDLCYYDDTTKNNILHLAVEQKNDPEYTRLVLLHTDKISVTQENKSKQTPLLFAIEKDNERAVKLFIELCIQRKTPQINGIIWKDDTTPEKYLPEKEWAASNTSSTNQVELVYDFTPDHLGKAFLALVKANKLDLALELFEKRPDTRINMIDPETNNNIAHCAALSKHPQKDKLFLLLCKQGVNLEQANKTGQTPLTILAKNNEYDILITLFTTLKSKFSLETLQNTAKDIIIGKEDLRYLSEYLLQVQSHPAKEISTKQEHTKQLLITLIDRAKSEEEVKKIGGILRNMEKQIPYFYPPTSFWNSISTSCSIDVMQRAYNRIMEFSSLKTAVMLPSSPDAKEVELQQLALTIAKKVG